MINISHTNPGATGKTAKEGTNPTLSIWTFLLLFSSYSSSFYILWPEKAWAPSLSSLTSQENFLPPSFLLPVRLGLFSHVESITCPVATQDRATPETEWKIKTEKVITANAFITESVMRIKLHDHTPASEGYEDLWKADLTLRPFPPDNLHCRFAAIFTQPKTFTPSWQYLSASKWPHWEVWVLRLSNDCISMDVSLLFSQGIIEPCTKSCEGEWEISWI